jgi:hypothetical protein
MADDLKLEGGWITDARLRAMIRARIARAAKHERAVPLDDLVAQLRERHPDLDAKRIRAMVRRLVG